MTIAPDRRTTQPIGAASAPLVNDWHSNEDRRRGESDYLDIGLILKGVRRQIWLGILFAAVGVGFSLVHLMTTQPLYTAYGNILLDSERAELLDLVSALPSAALGDAAVQSEVEILKSHELAMRVVDRLNLVERRDELRVEPSLVARGIGLAKGWVGDMIDTITGAEADEEVIPADVEAEQESPRRTVAEAVRGGLTVDRVGRSYVIEIAYDAPDPVLAMQIAKAYTQAYLAFQLEANANAAKSAVDWLQERVGALREESLDARRQLERYRRDNNLVSVGGGRLLTEQELSEVMSQLIVAEAEAARAGAVWAQRKAMLDGGVEATVAGVQSDDERGSSSAVDLLRSQYLEALSRRGSIVDQFGEDHPEAVRLKREIERLESLMKEELKRRVVSAKNTYEAEESRVEALRKGLSEAIAGSSNDEDSLSRLGQLEQTNTAYQQMYQDALSRMQKAIQQQSVPIVAARVISEPDLPKDQSSPSKSRVVALGLVLGLLFGGGVGALREARRDVLENKDDVERLLDRDLVGTLPHVGSPLGLIGTMGRLKSVLDRRKSSRVKVHPQMLRAARAIKLAVDERAPPAGALTLAIVSARPGEGKTMLSINLAAMLAHNGFATLLIDADPYSMTATRLLAPDVGKDMTSAMGSEAPMPVEQLPSVGDPSWNLMPLSTPQQPFAGVLKVGTERFNLEFVRYRTAFDYIIVDVPAAAEGPEHEALARYVDAAVVVNRRRHASASEVRDLSQDSEWASKVVGVFLNRG